MVGGRVLGGLVLRSMFSAADPSIGAPFGRFWLIHLSA
jgi:hypothetical protein